MADSGSGSRPPGRRPTKKGGCQRGSRLAPSQLLDAAVEVYWQDDFQWYKGRITELRPDGRHQIHYEDGDVELLNMREQIWRLAAPGPRAQGSSGRQQGNTGPSGDSCSLQQKRRAELSGEDPDTAHEGTRRLRHKPEPDKPADAGEKAAETVRARSASPSCKDATERSNRPFRSPLLTDGGQILMAGANFQVMELRLKRMQYEVAFFVDADKVQQMSLSYGPHWVMLQEAGGYGDGGQSIILGLPMELDTTQQYECVVDEIGTMVVRVYTRFQP